mgnify:CR=1 FL=1
MVPLIVPVANAFGVDPLHLGIIFAAVAAALQLGAGNAINDYFDREIDKIGKPLRPIPSGRISPANAKIYAAALFALSLVFAGMINIYAFLLAAFNIFVSYIYSAHFKKTPYGHFVVSYMIGSMPIFASLIAEKIPPAIFLLAGMNFFANLMREVAKGIEDYKADKKLGARTLEIEFGKEKAAAVGIGAAAIGILLSPLPIYFGLNFNYIFVSAIADLVFAYCAYLLWKSREETLVEAETTGEKVQKYSKLGMIISLVAFAVGIL